MRCALTCSAESWRSGVPGMEDCLVGEECGGFSMAVLLLTGSVDAKLSAAGHCTCAQSSVREDAARKVARFLENEVVWAPNIVYSPEEE